jgi:hypothetical protein
MVGAEARRSALAKASLKKKSGQIYGSADMSGGPDMAGREGSFSRWWDRLGSTGTNEVLTVTPDGWSDGDQWTR